MCVFFVPILFFLWWMFFLFKLPGINKKTVYVLCVFSKYQNLASFRLCFFLTKAFFFKI